MSDSATWSVLLAVASILVSVVLVRARSTTIIHASTVGLLYRDGEFRRVLLPGRYTRTDPFKRTHVVRVSTAGLPVVLPEVTVMSKDQFSFRLALSPILLVTDPRQFIESQLASEPNVSSSLMTTVTSHAALHTLTAAAAVEIVSTKTLANVMADPKRLLDEVCSTLQTAVPGATVTSLLLTAINLPPETRRMFTDIERTKIEAQGAIERARGEQAALRILANAARLVSDNPAVAHLRLIQAIEVSKGSTTVIIGEPSSRADPSRQT